MTSSSNYRRYYSAVSSKLQRFHSLSTMIKFVCTLHDNSFIFQSNPIFTQTSFIRRLHHRGVLHLSFCCHSFMYLLHSIASINRSNYQSATHLLITFSCSLHCFAPISLSGLKRIQHPAIQCLERSSIHIIPRIQRRDLFLKGTFSARIHFII